MRPLANDDMYLLSAVIDKMGITHQISDAIVTAFEAAKEAENKKESMTELIRAGSPLVILFFAKMHLAKDEINQLLASVTGKAIDEVKKMPISETKKLLQGIFTQEGVIDFFK